VATQSIRNSRGDAEPGLARERWPLCARENHSQLTCPKTSGRWAGQSYEEGGNSMSCARSLVTPSRHAEFRDLIGQGLRGFRPTTSRAHAQELARPTTSCLELFHGPTLAFKDFAMPADRPRCSSWRLAARRAGDNRGRDSGDPGFGHHRSVPRPRQCRMW